MRITDERVEQALTFRAQNLEMLAALQAESERLENMKHAVKAVLMQESGEKSAAAQEVWAYAHERYENYLHELKEARMVFLTLKGRMQHEADIIEVWRTSSANQRTNV